MINKERLAEVLFDYKRDFIQPHWEEESYKWEIIKHFQDNWDIKAKDFSEMLSRSLDQTSNLLASANYFPKRMICEFAEMNPETVRAMFLELFDATKDVYDRINAFKNKSDKLLVEWEEYKNVSGKAHYQNENSISTYLWLRYPDTYYIYKLSEVKVANEVLEAGYAFKKGKYADNIHNFMLFYNELRDEIIKDTELIKLFKSQLSSDYYSDPEYRTLTFDVGFYISRYFSQKDNIKVEEAEWFPADYTPGLTVEQWVDLLNDEEIFTTSSLEIMKRLKDYGGEATCTQLAVKYGETKNFYNAGSVALAKRVVDRTGCPVMPGEEDNSRWWPVLYVGRHAAKDEEGSYVWRLRNELSDALDRVDMEYVELFAQDTSDDETRGYWWLNANPKIWSFSDLRVGEIQEYTLFNENGNKRRIYQNFLDAKKGDLVIGYESNPVKQVVALARISEEQDGEKICIEKVEGLATPIDYQTLKDCAELEKMEYFGNPQGSLFKLTKGEYELILDMVREENPSTVQEKMPSYSKECFLDKVFMSEANYENLVAVLKNKQNIILQGAPGVGKTFAAKRLAYSLMGKVDESRLEFIQFHQNYSYEDFIMGYKPVEDGFELKNGIFYRFCQKAANHPDDDYFFIIDEINRGNMSKIFGELLMLIEKDYRDTKAILAYNGLPFSVPKNLYIIGMMNTADRSLAMIDYALRRRFSFVEMEPGFDSDGFVKYQKSLNDETLDLLIDKVKELNKEISLDKSLGKGFCIGHSYFCGKKECSEEWLHTVVDYDILPMLREYWFDEPNKVQRWENIFNGVFE